MLAVIGGSGLGKLANLTIEQIRHIPTPYGEPSGALTIGQVDGHPLVFLARHGDNHTIPPHQINYRANIWALATCAPTAVIAVAAVGGIRRDLAPGDLVVPHQIIDYTWGRESSYHQLPDGALRHIDFTAPYDAPLRRRLLDAASATGIALGDAAVYAATQGPRLETAAEVDRLERDGADVVGMTGMPEAALARELGLPYAALNVVANRAAGRGDGGQAIDMAAIEAVLAAAMQRVRTILAKLASDDD